ncbi:hypothetical protein ACJIZ3_016145 [Penstemon smallii]|uniref:Uncharacterized protein n=1 Tax=Penstemon smallii TaxID=265156 RepID=A0ABD3RPI9_9LAMI
MLAPALLPSKKTLEKSAYSIQGSRPPLPSACPEDGVEGVVIGCGESVLRGEAILDGGNHGGELGSDVVAEVVENDGGGTEEDEIAAVEVDDEGELFVLGWVEGNVEADVGFALWAEIYVLRKCSWCGCGGVLIRGRIHHWDLNFPV